MDFSERKFLELYFSEQSRRKVRRHIININEDGPVFFPLVLKRVNAVVVATISIIHAQNCVFRM